MLLHISMWKRSVLGEKWCNLYGKTDAQYDDWIKVHSRSNSAISHGSVSIGLIANTENILLDLHIPTGISEIFIILDLKP